MTGTRKGRMTVRARLGDTWDELEFDVSPDETVASIKTRALATQKLLKRTGADYEMKLGGALVKDESKSVSAAGATEGSTFMVLSKRRRPVR